MIDSHAFSKPSAETRNYTIFMHKQGSLQNGAGVKLLHYTQKKSSKGSSQENAETRNYIISMHKQGLYTSLQEGSGVKLLHYTQNKAQKGHLKRIF